MDKTAVMLMAKFGGLALLVLMVVFVIAAITPRISKFLEKRLPKSKKAAAKAESVAEAIDPADYAVKGPYDAQIGKKKDAAPCETSGEESGEDVAEKKE